MAKVLDGAVEIAGGERGQAAVLIVSQIGVEAVAQAHEIDRPERLVRKRIGCLLLPWYRRKSEASLLVTFPHQRSRFRFLRGKQCRRDKSQCKKQGLNRVNAASVTDRAITQANYPIRAIVVIAVQEFRRGADFDAYDPPRIPNGQFSLGYDRPDAVKFHVSTLSPCHQRRSRPAN